MAKINAPGLRQAIKQQFQASRKRWLSVMDAAWFDITKGVIKHFTEQNNPLLFLRSDGEWAAPPAGGGGVPTTRVIATTSPLAGGGDLSADRTLTIDVGTAAGQVAAGDHTHAQADVTNLVSDLAALTASVTAKQDADSDLTAISGLATNGVLVRSAGPAYATRAIGNSAGSNVLDRDAGDGRYALLSAVLSPTDADPQIMLPPWFAFKDAFTATTLGSTQCQAYYFGRAKKAYTSFIVRLRVTTQISGATWGEIAIGKSTAPVAASNASITVVGTTDITTSHSTIGNKSDTVAVAGGQSVAVGDHLWVVMGKLSTGSPSYRSISTIDELDFGIVLDAGNVRPSTILGTPTTFAANQFTRNPIHFGVYVS
jgi:hypothetical protein